MQGRRKQFFCLLTKELNGLFQIPFCQLESPPAYVNKILPKKKVKASKKILTDKISPMKHTHIYIYCFLYVYIDWKIASNFLYIYFYLNYLASLLLSLQVQTFHVPTPAIGKIHSFNKITVTFEPMQ